MGNSGPILSGQNVTLPVFDVHKYSHGFSNFNDIIIQFFRKTSVMTVATLALGDATVQYSLNLVVLLSVNQDRIRRGHSIFIPELDLQVQALV